MNETTMMEANKVDFIPFGKIPRLSRECVISCKIDGTNASILIAYISKEFTHPKMLDYFYGPDGSTWGIFAGSRTRWITPEDDNYGFAKWVLANKEIIKKLGPGLHRGEWMGQGVNRGYGLKEKRFYLFNTFKFIEKEEDRTDPSQIVVPAPIRVVPVLTRCNFDVINDAVHECMEYLKCKGSIAVDGWMKPEGIVVYFTSSGTYMKKTIEDDEKPKSCTT